jgi:phosphopantothenoylcysteine synthetase/decarboxylase
MPTCPLIFPNPLVFSGGIGQSSRLPFTPLAIRCLITAGPTREFFDPVRFVSNPSTGKMGFAIAAAAKAAGWTVDLVSGPVALPEPAGVMLYPVVTADEMLRQTDALFGPCDVLIMTAAVSDWRPKVMHPQKLKKDGAGLTVEFEPVPDILATLAQRRRPDQLLVGFAAETENVEANALAKLDRKGIDLVAANSVAGPDGAFGSDLNRLILLGRDGFRQALGPATKAVVAQQLIATLAARLAAPAR